ncbi:MAG: helix-hairpin-helix domain-containing protein, partial [Bacteroidia bacterium]
PMTTEAIADALKLTAQLQELHGENPFKVKALSSAAYTLDKTNMDLSGKTLAELEAIQGIGKSIAAKIVELQHTGTTAELTALLGKTPGGVAEMLDIKGIGPKKVAQLWKELGAESPGELLYACLENRLTDLKGFGAKTQEQVKKAIEFKLSSRGKFHYASALPVAEAVKQQLLKAGIARVEITGAVRRCAEVIEHLEFVAETASAVDESLTANALQLPVTVHICGASKFAAIWFRTTAAPDFLLQLERMQLSIPEAADSEAAIFATLNMSEIAPELREGRGELVLAANGTLPKLITVADLHGNLHNHSTYSDGVHTLREMAEACRKLGFSYYGSCDHSKSAFYAQGLKPERVLEQFAEIDALNAEFGNDFKVFKGIESDILNDGLLDYDEDLLKQFDFIVASVHSVLKMDKERATTRLLRAIENPYTRILGHPTGRLLLSREGYPIDHEKVIDACAANGVAIELNAHPWRLDIDWRWIPYCLEKGVLISINPDAHATDGLRDVQWGVAAARKGMLTAENCLNAKTLAEFTNWLARK